MVQAAHSDEYKHDKVRSLINKIGTAFMVTHSSGGQMHGRPMAVAEVKDGVESLWFATQRNSGKTEELASDDHVFLGFVNATGSDWVTVNGRGRIVDDRAKNRELWSPIWKNWFSGPEDPNLVLIEVTPESAEYWDNGSQAIAMLKFAVAAVTGKKMNEGDHGHVDFNRGGTSQTGGSVVSSTQTDA
ncbi:MAG: pyridoxamine 5'-phosphate oxidase family protein [Tepidisphaeraceae bacterium]